MLVSNYNPDVLTCIANLSNDEVFSPPQLVNRILDILPADLWSDKKITFLDPGCKSGVFLREIVKRLDKVLGEPIGAGLIEQIARRRAAFYSVQPLRLIFEHVWFRARRRRIRPVIPAETLDQAVEKKLSLFFYGVVSNESKSTRVGRIVFARRGDGERTSPDFCLSMLVI